MEKNWEGSARLHSLPNVKFPVPFPTDAKLPRLMFGHLKEQDPAKAVTFAKAVFGQYWGEGKDIAKPEQLAGILKTQDIPEAELAAAAEDAAARQAVIDTTAAAGQLNAFGTPTFLDRKSVV